LQSHKLEDISLELYDPSDTESKLDFAKQGINSHLRIKNIVGSVLEFWLTQVSGSKKIIVQSILARATELHKFPRRTESEQ